MLINLYFLKYIVTLTIILIPEKFQVFPVFLIDAKKPIVRAY